MESSDNEEDIDFEPEDEMGTVGAAQTKMKKLREQLKEAQSKRDEYLAGWQREKADSINARKEFLSSVERDKERAKESLIEQIIPVLDSFDLASSGESWNSVDSNWRSGIESIRSQLLGVLSSNGVERYGKVGYVFDHGLHEALQETEDEEGESGEIVRIVRYGYKVGDRIIRPAQVIVKK